MVLSNARLRWVGTKGEAIRQEKLKPKDTRSDGRGR